MSGTRKSRKHRPQKMSQFGIDLLKNFEGYRNRAYPDSGGVWTIGYGHTGPDVGPKTQINRQKAELLLRQDIDWAEDTVRDNCTVPLNQNQFDALVSFTYNIGSTAFRNSTCLRKLNTGDYQGAADQLLRWNRVKGKVIRGLVKRRRQERALFLTVGD